MPEKTFKEMAERAAWLYRTGEQLGAFNPTDDDEIGTLGEVQKRMVTQIAEHVHPEDGE